MCQRQGHPDHPRHHQEEQLSPWTLAVRRVRNGCESCRPAAFQHETGLSGQCCVHGSEGAQHHPLPPVFQSCLRSESTQWEWFDAKTPEGAQLSVSGAARTTDGGSTGHHQSEWLNNTKNNAKQASSFSFVLFFSLFFLDLIWCYGQSSGGKKRFCNGQSVLSFLFVLTRVVRPTVNGASFFL